MKFTRKFLLLLTIATFPLLVSAGRAEALLIYQGFLDTPAGIDGTGDWNTNFKISWLVEEQANQTWKYTYQLTKATTTQAISTSHMTLEISPEANSSHFSNFNGSPLEFGLIDETKHGALGSLQAVKMDYESSLYSFFSEKVPVWGDFFVKGGRASCCGPANTRPFNAAWNADFLDPDPTAGPVNGLLSDGQGGSIYKILRPDSTETNTDTSTPEPASLMLLGLGLISGSSFLKRFK